MVSGELVWDRAQTLGESPHQRALKVRLTDQTLHPPRVQGPPEIGPGKGLMVSVRPGSHLQGKVPAPLKRRLSFRGNQVRGLRGDFGPARLVMTHFGEGGALGARVVQLGLEGLAAGGLGGGGTELELRH